MIVLLSLNNWMAFLSQFLYHDSIGILRVTGMNTVSETWIILLIIAISVRIAANPVTVHPSPAASIAYVQS